MMSAPLPTVEDQRDTATFEALMWAMARPGTIHDLPEGLSDLILALVDRECKVMVDDPALARLVATTGATLVSASLADHAFCLSADRALAVLTALPGGSALYPDQGATLVLPARLGQGPALRLSGPGVDGTCDVRIGGLPDGFLAARAARCRYPEGIEIAFVDGRRVMGLPRSTTVKVL
ncbi:MAG: phosphonate C-P lyase system protein PhnH [Rhodobacteraceae bacterium]|nr:phosphonate C-P lyase system protein PhnH [Paracoccaceae bacterium]MCF8514128.1 phosphonate C-P lyase system protein PhnH [Paracoccaceae bacterium]MCF8518372.1 phosphonate C-P lyase system protein PhnH [Paracoccaceae bacterium]